MLRGIFCWNIIIDIDLDSNINLNSNIDKI